MPTPIALPDDINALKALVTELQAAVVSRSEEIERLKLLIEKLQRMLFGRRSEKLLKQVEQLQTELEELQIDEAVDAPIAPISKEATDASASKDQPPKRRPVRKPLPEHLPREIETHPPQTTVCPECGGAWKQIGEDVSEVLEYVPASFRVIKHVRPKMACCCCDCMAQAAAPSRPIERSFAGPGLLAHVLISKFADHIPLYRQNLIYQREQVVLSDSTLADWVGGCSRLLQPLVDVLHDHVLSGDKVHADDTPVPVLAPGQGKTKTGRLWTYVRDDRPSGDSIPPAVWFAYSPDRKGEHPQNHLKDFKGILQADAFAGFDKLYESGAIQEAACWAHARRKIYDLHVSRPSAVTQAALEQIAALYAVEAEIRGKPPAERKVVRQARSKILLTNYLDWINQTLPKLSRKSDTTVALQYTLNHWDALARFVDDGRIEIDNNVAERSLRGVAIGRRNYMFMGSDAGGHRAAAIYSLIGTAKLNGLNPEAYLRQVLSVIADYRINQISDLLPWNIAENCAVSTPISA